MTARQIRLKLERASIPTAHVEITRDEIEVAVPNVGEPGVDYDATEALRERVSIALGGWGGYRTGYGGWVLRAGYRFAPTDYCAQEIA